MKWISVKQVLPEHWKPVLCYLHIDGKFKCRVGQWARHKPDGEFPDEWVGLLTRDEKLYSKSEVTHWMPLPDPPEEEL